MGNIGNAWKAFCWSVPTLLMAGCGCGCGHNGNWWMGVVWVWPHWQWMDGRGRGVTTMALDGWAWLGCDYNGNGWMVGVWLQCHWMDGHGRGVTIMVMDGWAWLGCDYNDNGWMGVIGVPTQALSEPMLDYSQFDLIEHISMKSQSKFIYFHSTKCISKSRLRNCGYFQCVN